MDILIMIIIEMKEKFKPFVASGQFYKRQYAFIIWL